MVSVNAGEIISMNKEQTPAVHVAFLSIGKIDAESNSKYAKVFFALFSTKGIQNDRYTSISQHRNLIRIQFYYYWIFQVFSN